MASTNKTTHYELSQYVGTDKPTYLTDYNGDMLAIDTGIYNAQTKADSAYSAAGVADGKAGDAQTTANTAVTSASTANTNIGTMANLNTTEKTNLVGAINEVNTLAGTAESNVEKLNLTSFTTYTENSTGVTISTGALTGMNITVASNSDGSLGKIYGTIYTTIPTSGPQTVTIPGTALRPTSSISINNLGLSWFSQGQQVIAEGVSINTNGDITFNLYVAAGGTSRHEFSPCLLFMKDFGDAPNP